MIAHTQAFKRLKDETQEVLDFAVLISYAVPFLKHGIKKSQSGPSPLLDTDLMPFRPDNFGKSTTRLGKAKDSASKYKHEISKSIRLVGFSYFEVYVGDIIKEILEFHAAGQLSNHIRSSPKLEVIDTAAQKAHSKLREYPKKGKSAKYLKYQDELATSGFSMPYKRALILGLERMERQSQSYKASQIPSMVTDLLGLELSASELEDFSAIREARNRIAHGRATEDDMIVRTALQANLKLRELALRIDEHVLKYWMIADPISLPHVGM